MACVCSLVDAAVNCWAKSKGAAIRVDGLAVVTGSGRETSVRLFKEEASPYAMLLETVAPHHND